MDQVLTKSNAIMEENKIFYPAEYNAAIKTTKRVNGNTHSNGIPYDIKGEKKIGLDPLMLRLQEMERLNVSFEKLLDQRTKELAEAVDANAKSISVIAHDLRLPICTVLNALEIIKDELIHHDTGEMEYFIKIASGSAYNAINLLDNLAEWAMLQNGENKFRPVKINLNQFIVSEIENSVIYAKQKQISLNFAIIPDLNVYIDLQMVSTILRNLVSNAIKFTDSGGEITVSARLCHPYVEIEVADNGIGISVENQEKIFAHEKILLGQLTRNRQGSGLGLKLCNEFAAIHGGHISLDSKPGEGSKFRFTLPV
jgi:two-component system, sensor histidine kinase and response regulator